MSLSCSVLVQGQNLCKKQIDLSSRDGKFCFQHSHKCKIEKPENCNICLDILEEETVLECGHSFHIECINKWLELKDNCPCCRHIIKEVSYFEHNEEYNQDYNLDSQFREWLKHMIYLYVNIADNDTIDHVILSIVVDSSMYHFLFREFLNETNGISLRYFEIETMLNSFISDLYNNDISNTLDINLLDFTSFEDEF